MPAPTGMIAARQWPQPTGPYGPSLLSSDWAPFANQMVQNGLQYVVNQYGVPRLAGNQPAGSFMFGIPNSKLAGSTYGFIDSLGGPLAVQAQAQGLPAATAPSLSTQQYMNTLLQQQQKAAKPSQGKQIGSLVGTVVGAAAGGLLLGPGGLAVGAGLGGLAGGYLGGL